MYVAMVFQVLQQFLNMYEAFLIALKMLTVGRNHLDCSSETHSLTSYTNMNFLYCIISIFT